MGRREQLVLINTILRCKLLRNKVSGILMGAGHSEINHSIELHGMDQRRIA